MKINFKKLSSNAQIPQRMTPGAAGFDLFSAHYNEIAGLSTMTFGCGFAAEIPPGFGGLICPRSGLATEGITVFNGPGVIDSDYRGEIKVVLFNLWPYPRQIRIGDRIAQLLIVPVADAEWVKTERLSDSQRGENGLGSTGAA